MPTPKRGPRMGGSSSHQKAILANQASDLFRHGRIKTTEAKAKMLRPYAEKLITKAKVGDLHNRRQVLASLRNKDVTAYLFDEVAPRFADRDGGYTRILKLGPRQGDSTRMALIELVERGAGSGEEQIEEAKASRGRGLFGRRRKNAGGLAVAERAEAEAEAEASEASSASEDSASASSESSESVSSESSDSPVEVSEASADEAVEAPADEAAADEASADKA